MLRAPSRTLRPAVLLAALVALGLGACDDPTPIFGGGWPWPGGTTGSLGAEAYLPDDGEWILPGAPTLDAVFPVGSGHHARTPVVLRFSESVAAETLNGALSLRALSGAGGGFGLLTTTHRLGNGRVVVLLPSAPLLAGETYAIEVEPDAAVTDLTGQPWAKVGQLAQFTVATTNPVLPSVVATWPPDGAEDQGASGEVVVVFDRPMDPGGVDSDSFAVTVDGGPPPFDADPVGLSVDTGLFPVTDWRVMRWISTDGAGATASLGDGVDVTVTLSAVGSELDDPDGNVLATTSFDFRTADLPMPLGAALESDPDDAVGLANLVAGGAEELQLRVDVPGALAGDVIDIYVFGKDLQEMDTTVATHRSVTVDLPTDSVLLDLADLGLVASTSPLAAAFADGDLAFAFSRKRTATSPVRNLDVDPDAVGIQDALLDTVAPELVELFGEDPDTGEVRAELAELTLSGRADEELRRALVTTSLGDNSALPEVLGARADGSFLAFPVAVGDLDPSDMPLDFDLVVYDRALNPSAVHSGTFVQRGRVGPAPLVAGADVTVLVYDAETLAPVEGARAFTHQGTAGHALVQTQTTPASGLATLATDPGGPTTLTVEAPGYHILSVVDVAAARVELPLRPLAPEAVDVEGLVTAGSDLAELTLLSLVKRHGDTRRPVGAEDVFPGGSCTSNPFGGAALECPYGPEAIVAGRVGASSFVAGNMTVSLGAFSAATALRAFSLVLPVAPGDADADPLASEVDHEVSLLDEPGAPEEGFASELDVLAFDASGLLGVDLGSLDGDSGTIGDPRAAVEVVLQGIPGTTSAGVGLAYDLGGGVWTVRSAAPGAVLAGGALSAAVVGEPYVSVELRDTAGARTARRLASSALAALPTPFLVVPVDPPSVLLPLPGASTGGASYTVDLTDSLPDAVGTGGLFEVVVTDPAGRSWSLWVPDPAGAGTVSVHLPALATAGGTPLADGTQTIFARSVRVPGLVPTSFRWSDLEREHDVTAEGLSVTVSQP